MNLAEALDRTLSIGRIPAVTGVGWGGDMDDEYATVASSVPCRIEITDIDQYTIWIMDDVVTPRVGDLVLITDWEPQLEVIRVQHWTRSTAEFHHFEMAAKPVYPTRRFVDA